jgi:hypothetical protein
VPPDLYMADQDPTPDGEHEETGEEHLIVPSVWVYAVGSQKPRSQQQDEQVEKPPSLPVPRFLLRRASLRQESGGQGSHAIPSKVATREKYRSWTPVPTTSVLGTMANVFQIILKS